VVHSVLLVALTAGLFGMLPRVGGLNRDARALRPFGAGKVLMQRSDLGGRAQQVSSL
jgi:hypothetical protein